jgi:hypothetical protein
MKEKILIAAVVVVFAGAGAARADIQFQGTTSATLSGPSAADFSFLPGSFDLSIPPGGSANLTNLGTLTLTPSCAGQNCTETIDTTFNLIVSFTLPTITVQPFTTELHGTVKRSGKSNNFTGNFQIDFAQNTQTLTYTTTDGGLGSFDLFVDDGEIKVNGDTRGATTIAGGINKVTFVAAENHSGDPDLTQVPEPASILMLGTAVGLAALGVRRRRARG